MTIARTLAKPSSLPHLGQFSLSKLVRPLDEATGIPELRYARNHQGERVLCMRWAPGGSAHDDLKAFWREELRTLRQLAHGQNDVFAPIVAAQVNSEGFHLVLARDGRNVMAELVQHKPWPCETLSDRAHTWRNLSHLAKALHLLHERGIAHSNVSRWSVLAKPHRTDHFQLIGYEWSMRARNVFLDAEQDVIRQIFARDWRDFAALARSLLGGDFASVELTPEEQSLLHALEHLPHADGWRVERRTLNMAAALEAPARQRVSKWSLAADGDPHILALRGLLLAQVLQMLLRAGSEFPVEVVDATPVNSSSGMRHWRVRLRARPNARHALLCQMLGIRTSLARRLYEALMEPPSTLSESWFWVSNEDDEESEVELSFVHVQERGERLYLFHSGSTLPKFSGGVLINAQGGRADQQFRRQLRAWRALRLHPALLEDLLNPSASSTTVSITLLEDDRFAKLDADKQQALRRALATEPLTLTHGPPGVGKTTLVAELVRQMTWIEPGSKLLFSAQSHAAVDHLLTAVRKNAPADALIVRCHAPDAKRVGMAEDLPRQVAAVLSALRDSAGLAHASSSLREIIRSLIEGNTRSTHASATRFHRRPLEAHLLRAATLVFGTSNCASFEHLFNERVQFDLSVIEEAAKATGNDLLNALLLARRQLLIGDHHQLPPFESEKLEKLLASPPQVAQLLSNLPDAVATLFENEIELREMQRLFEQSGSNERQVAQVCQSALRTLFLFKTLVTAPETMGAAGYASALTLQHRMHPAISSVVSHAFYGDLLHPHPDCIARFTRETSPVRFNGQHYPQVPILWVDTPWIQSEFGDGQGEQKPGPVNRMEVNAVVQVLQSLEQNPHAATKPSLAILTPYRKQLLRLKTAVGRLPVSTSIEQFAPIGGTYCHTVDSFQGNEADVVIVSLVRNNAHHTLSRALGFLQDERRMTVLMSRAKWRLIVVGSVDFLRATLKRHSEGAQSAVAFLALLLDAIEDARKDSMASIVRPYHSGQKRGPRR
jgi:hypothetical protein